MPPADTPSRSWPAGRVRTLAGPVLIVALLAACASGPGPGPAAGVAAEPVPVVPPSPPGTVDGRFPAVVDHGFGRTVVPAVPRTVVALGYSDKNTLLALGMVPAGVAELDPVERIPPRARPPVLAIQVPGRFGFTDPALRGVDLIVDTTQPMAPETYAADREIAPTVTAPAGAGDTTSWQDTTRLVGRAVGRPATAERLVGDLEGRFARARARYPKLAGHRGLCVTTDGHSTELYRVDPPDGPCARFLAELGLRGVPELQHPDDSTEGAVHSAYGGLSATAFTGANAPDVVLVSDLAVRLPGTLGQLPPELPKVVPSGDEGYAVGVGTVAALPSVVDPLAAKLAAALR